MRCGRPVVTAGAAALAVTAAGLCSVVVGVLLLAAGPPVPGDAGTLPGALPEYGPAVARAVPARVAPPRGLVVPGVLRAPVDPVAAGTDGALQVPEAPHRLGWWALGALPGQARGTVLLVGHLDSAAEGPGAFAALPGLRLGTRVDLTDTDGRRHRYEITARRTYPREALPRDLFTTAGPPRLALVTCAGRFDPAARRYEENLVLYGRPAAVARPVEERRARREP